MMRTDQSGVSVVPAEIGAIDSAPYDAILIVGFGGPEHAEDVLPFLENVTRGRNIPRERLLEVAEHYHHFDGVSPINSQIRDLIAALRAELDRHGVAQPIYWGNRNWHPLLTDTLREMSANGVKRALAFVHAGYSSYSSCRQYREDIGRAQDAAGAGAPVVDKIRVFYNHPDFITANADRIRMALDGRSIADCPDLRVVFTAHSIPVSMARNCRYEHQLTEACRLIAQDLDIAADRWALVYQSRSGRPGDPWLEPDILDYLRELRQRGIESVLIHPIGFLSDNMEVMYDLDEEARHLCEEIGLLMVRSKTVGIDHRFVGLVCELIRERIAGTTTRRAVGLDGPSHDVCPATCCLPAARPSAVGDGRPG
jgi:ferrochelatase